MRHLLGVPILATVFACAAQRGPIDQEQAEAPPRPPVAVALERAAGPRVETAVDRLAVVRPLGDGARSSSSPLALIDLDDERAAVVADADDRALLVVAIDGGETLARADLDGTPAHVLVDPRGRVHTSLRDADAVASFELVRTADGALRLASRARLATPAEPIALALADEGATLLVSCGRGRALVGHPLVDTGRTLQVALAHAPRGVAVDGDRVWVAHAIGSRASIVSLDQAAVIRDRRLHWRDLVDAPWGAAGDVARFAVQGFAVALAEGRVVVPMVLAYPGEPELRNAGYGGSIDGLEPFFPHEPVLVELSRTTDDGRLRLRRELVDIDDRRPGTQRRAYPRDRPPCLLPRGIAIDPTRGHLLVACEDLATVIGYAANDDTLDDAEVARWHVGTGATAVAVDPATDVAWVWSAIYRRLERVALGARGDAATPEATIPIAAGHPRPDLAGRIAFHEPRGFDGRSCASCHIDGRDDGLVWLSPEGMVQTPTLAGRVAGTAPFGWSGSAPDLVGHMTKTMRRLRAPKPDPATLDALASYLASMPTHRATDREPSAAAIRGEAIFFSDTAGCAACHVAGDGVDGNQYAVVGRRRFDTPSLRLVGDSAPYMHDGRFATLREVLVETDGTMAHTGGLADTDVGDLIAYLETL